MSASFPDEAELARFFDYGLDLFCVASFDGYFLHVNHAWTTALGWSQQELTTRPWLEFVHPEDIDATETAGQQLVNGELVAWFANRYRCKDGSYRWLNWIARPSTDHRKIYGVARDITEQKATFEQLARVYRELSDIKRATDEHAIVAVTDARGVITEVNEKFVTLSGYLREELIGSTHRLVNSAHHPREFFVDLWRTISQGKVWQGEICNRAKNGSYYWVHTTITPFLDAKGQPFQYVAMRTDVSERKQGEMAAQAHRTRLLAVLNAMAEGMVVQAMDGSIIECNPAAERILGLTADQMSGRKSIDPRWHAIHEDGSLFAGETHPSMTVLRTGVPQRDVMMGVHKPDNTLVWISINATPFVDADGSQSGVVCTFADVTARLRLEAQLRQGQKMQAIGTLAGGIAHDFNNILAAVQGYTQLAKSDTKALPEVQTYLDAVLQGANRAATLVKQMATFTRMDAVQSVPVRLQVIIAEAMELLRPTIPATISIHIDARPEVPAVIADPTQMHQIVVNLCTNAWQAMKADQGGHLDIRLASVDLDETFASTHPDVSIGQHVKLSVGDSGSGMDQATMGRIFEPFFTTKAPGAGTGLGLAVVHGIVKNHGGVVEVHSRPGEGSTFDVYLPACHIEIREERRHDEVVQRSNGQRVLFVDDEVSLIKLGASALQKMGYVVTPFSDPLAAVNAFLSTPHEFDVVITDYAMPVMSGLVLAEKLFAIKPDAIVFMASGYLEDAVKDRAAALGIAHVIAKPYTTDQLMLLIQQVLGSRNTQQDGSA